MSVKWRDNSGAMKLRLAALLLTLVGATQSQIQMPIPPETEPGDVIYYSLDGKAYLWLHAADGRLTALNGFQPEQIYRFMLDRERSALQMVQSCSMQLFGMTAQKSCPR